MHFSRLDDSPMFRKQLHALEESAEILRERCQKFNKGCYKYTEGLGEAYDEDIAFASALDTFGGGHDDTISVAVGGPVMTKFTIALREIGTYKEVLRSQVEHMLNDRLTQFASIDLQDVKEVRRHFDKASLTYDQVREKFLSLKKNTKMDIVLEAEEDLRNARSVFEQARFNLVTALSNIEARKKFEFLEAVSGTMDAHLRYFKQGYELLLQMEPYIHQVLTYAQQSRERANFEQAALADRMQEFRRQIEQENQHSLSDVESSPTWYGIQAVGRSSHKMIAAVMQSTPRGKVQTIKQGYLLKHSSSLRGDWKRRFFVLDSRGMLYYYRKQLGKPMGGSNQHTGRLHISDSNGGLLSRFLAPHHVSPQDDMTLLHHTVNLLTSTIKVDAEQSDLRFCFRIISPLKNYTLQAENAMDRMDWIDKITGVIASLLNSQVSDQAGYGQRLSMSHMGSDHQHTASESSSWSGFSDFDHAFSEDPAAGRSVGTRQERPVHGLSGSVPEQQEWPINVLRKVPGNDVCADCNSPEPDWASLNLGILLCIECSGVHRNLGVHISKVRSLMLDVKVWEPSVIALFQSLGNLFANSIWEDLVLKYENERQPRCSPTNNDLERINSSEERPETMISIFKPDARDPLPVKEKYIYAKYAEKRFMTKVESDSWIPSIAHCIWDAVQTNNKQVTYYLIVNSDADVNTTYEQAMASNYLTLGVETSTRSILDPLQNFQSSWNEVLNNHNSTKSETQSITVAEKEQDNTGSTNSSKEVEQSMQGCTLLHLACNVGDLSMLELLLQYGAQVNAADSLGRSPLHHCILSRQHNCARFLLTRGASPSAMDNGRNTPLQTAMEMGAVTDEALFIMLSETNR
eukprot:c27186_g1_i1 orf=520-3096(-)